MADLERDGFVFYRGLAPGTSTLEVAQGLGKVVNVAGLLPPSRIPMVQSLKPCLAEEAKENRYSGHYGLSAFPLHTDLAHWATPPHYILLRCIVGSADVFTHVLPWAPIVGRVGEPSLRKALFTARNHHAGCSSLVRAMSSCDGLDLLRWDPIFLVPLNHYAVELTSTMSDPALDSEQAKILLGEPGDSLLIDNWQALHGRGRVQAHSRDRQVERIYLSEVLQ